MVLKIQVETSNSIELEEYFDYVSTNVDLVDLDSVAASASMLASLSNNNCLVVNELNKLIETEFRNASLSSAQSIYLGRGAGFYLRANIWPSASDLASGRLYQDQFFSYNFAHDHNYDFLTVHHFGPGYFTDIYEYDPSKITGYVGESVDLNFVERSLLGPKNAALYRSSRDVHIQFPPADMSITLNLMLSVPSAGHRNQYCFDLAGKRITGLAPYQDSELRMSIVRMAGYAGDEETKSLLTDLLQRHPCESTRIAAFEALIKLSPSDSVAILEGACRDKGPLVVKAAQNSLKALKG